MARRASVKPLNAQRNIVQCCDGTSNEPDSASTNVVRMFRCLKKTERQIVFYDPDIGADRILDFWKRRTNRITALAAPLPSMRAQFGDKLIEPAQGEHGVRVALAEKV